MQTSNAVAELWPRPLRQPIRRKAEHEVDDRCEDCGHRWARFQGFTDAILAHMCYARPGAGDCTALYTDRSRVSICLADLRAAAVDVSEVDDASEAA